jgi:hypothetical protein
MFQTFGASAANSTCLLRPDQKCFSARSPLLHSTQINEEKSRNNKEAHLALFGAVVGATFAAALSEAALLGLS